MKDPKKPKQVVHANRLRKVKERRMFPMLEIMEASPGEDYKESTKGALLDDNKTADEKIKDLYDEECDADSNQSYQELEVELPRAERNEERNEIAIYNENETIEYPPTPSSVSTEVAEQALKWTPLESPETPQERILRQKKRIDFSKFSKTGEKLEKVNETQVLTDNTKRTTVNKDEINNFEGEKLDKLPEERVLDTMRKFLATIIESPKDKMD